MDDTLAKTIVEANEQGYTIYFYKKSKRYIDVCVKRNKDLIEISSRVLIKSLMSPVSKLSPDFILSSEINRMINNFDVIEQLQYSRHNK